MNAEEYLKQELSKRELWNTETDDCYQVLAEITQDYTQSHITKLEQQVSDLETALIITKNSRKSHIEKHKNLEARNKELETALKDLLNVQNNCPKYKRDRFIEIAEQALNKK